MGNSKEFQIKQHSLIKHLFVLVLLFSTSSFADTLQRQKEGTIDLEDTNIVFLFSGDQAQSIIAKLTKAEVKSYSVYGGTLKVYIGTNVICLDRTPSIDDKSTSCRMVVNERGDAVDIRKSMKDFISSLGNLYQEKKP